MPKTVSITSRKAHSLSMQSVFRRGNHEPNCLYCFHAAVDIVKGRFENVCQKELPMDAKTCAHWRDARRPGFIGPYPRS